MKELQTYLGTDIPIETRAILYLCELNKDSSTKEFELTIIRELLFNSVFEGLEAYANIPNPESQLITGKTFDELITNLHTFHRLMLKQSWLEDLYQSI